MQVPPYERIVRQLFVMGATMNASGWPGGVPGRCPHRGTARRCGRSKNATFAWRAALRQSGEPYAGPLSLLIYMYDGTNKALNKCHWINLNETAILKSGLMLSRMREQTVFWRAYDIPPFPPVDITVSFEP